MDGHCMSTHTVLTGGPMVVMNAARQQETHVLLTNDKRTSTVSAVIVAVKREEKKKNGKGKWLSRGGRKLSVSVEDRDVVVLCGRRRLRRLWRRLAMAAVAGVADHCNCNTHITDRQQTIF